MEDEFEDYNGPVLEESEFEDYNDPDIGTPLEAEMRQNMPVDGPKGEETVSLPEPSTNMYEGMAEEDKQAVFDAYRRHPASQEDWLGNVQYNGKSVPSPKTFSSELERSGTGVALGTAWNVGKEALANSAMMGEEVSNIENPILRAAATAGNALVNPIGAIAGIIPGDQAQQIEENIPEFEPESKLGRFSEGVGEFAIGAALGDKGARTVASQVKNVPKWLKGTGRFFSAETAGVGTMNDDTDGLIISASNESPVLQGLTLDENGKYSRKRFNTKLRQIQDGVILSGLAGGVIRSAASAGNLTVVPMIKWLKDWRNLGSEEKKFVEVLASIAGDLPDNASKEQQIEAWSEMGRFLDENRDVVAKFDDPDVEDVRIANDSVTALVEFMEKKDPDKYAPQIQQLKGLRSSALGSGGSPKLENNLKKPEQAFKNTLDSFQDTREIDRSIPETNDMFQKKAPEMIQNSKDLVVKTEDDLSKLKSDQSDLIKDDPSFGPMVKDAESGTVPFNPQKETDNIADKITETTTVNRKGLEKDASAEYEKIAPASVTDGYEAIYGDIRSDLNPDLQKVFDNSSNWTELVTKGKPALNRYIKDVYKSDISKGDRLKEFSNYLNNATDDDVAKTALRDADQNFKKTVGPFRQGPIEDNRKVAKDFGPNRPDDIAVDQRKITKNALTDTDGKEHVARIRELLTKSGDEKLIDDYYIGNAVSDARQKLMAGQELNLQDIRKGFEKAKGGLSEAGQKRFETLMTKFNQKDLSIKEKSKILEDLKKNADIAEENVYGNILKDFFAKEPGGYKPKENGFDTFKKILNDSEGVTKVQKYMKVSNDPMVKKAFEGAWAKEAKEKYFSGKEIGKIDENFEKVGRVIYGDEIVDSIKLLADKTNTSQIANKTRMGQGLDTSQNQGLAVKAANNVITFVWGVLNPTAAKVRIITNDYMKSKSATDISRMAGDNILSSADTFRKVLKQMEAEKRFSLSPSEKMIIRKSLIPGYKATREEESSDQTKKLFNK